MKYFFLSIAFIILSFTNKISAQNNVVQPDTSQSLDSFLDTLVQSKMKKMHVPGAVISIVKEGEVIFNKGYGYANIEEQRTIDPEKTTFRLASISKPFTAIAIMKLVEEGKLQLHEDIRPQIKDRYEFDWEYPVTIHHILTHTTGLDYSSIGSHKSEGQVIDLNKKIKLLGQGHPSGDHFDYSNIAFGILGYLIEKHAGLPYHQYMKENILDPLKMVNSTFNTVLPPSIASVKAETYYWSNGKNHKQPRQFLSVPAASSLESTGSDMSKFMNAVLHPNIFEELGIISLESFNLMTSPQLPEITSHTIGYSFFLGNNRNNPSIYHSGGVRGFLSLYVVFPQQDLGIFIAQNNRSGAEGFAWNLSSELYDKLLPRLTADLSWVKNQNDRSIDIQDFAGIYDSPMHRNSTFEKGERLLTNNEIKVELVNDSMLSMFGHSYKRIANTTFLDTSKNSEWVEQFRLDENDQVDRIVQGLQSYKKLKWYKRIIYTQIIIGLAFLIFIIGFTITIRRFFSFSTKHISSFQKWILIIGNGYLLSFSALLASYFIIETIKEGVPLGFKIPLLFLTLFGILSLAFPWAIYKNAISDLSKKAKAWNYLSIGAILIVGLIFYNLNLIGMKW